MLRLRGEDRADYFHVLCADCGEHVNVTYLGYAGAVPMIRAECEKCGSTGKQKLMIPFWGGLPRDPA